MKAEIKWVEKRTFLGKSGSGFTLPFGTASGEDGIRPGPSAMELVLIGTGGCSAWDVVQILEKGRENIDDCVCKLDAERANEDPMVFTKIHMHFIVTGRGLNADKVARAISLSADKYCSASAMMAKTAVVTHDFEVVDSGA
ncbi:MAG: OsmC family protein [Rhodospirillaceae bacterium]|jgi:putative redox protein|nr:OsmC family protein [Rhodospirillaceae bacterium]MBT4426626.1 OsmC family protein [Rhodospirillaceae bacterium]MBT5779132.1 OsmC family protein [Rhodospirillaceae bacterium]MBT6830139.1 OsmC family protein [Rhodospirillaceae bacterium]